MSKSSILCMAAGFLLCKPVKLISESEAKVKPSEDKLNDDDLTPQVFKYISKKGDNEKKSKKKNKDKKKNKKNKKKNKKK